MLSSHLGSMKPRNAWKLQGAQKGTPKDFDSIKILLHNFGLTWYFSPSELLVTGIRTPSMSAYRAGVWCEKPGSLDCEVLGTWRKLFHMPTFNLFQVIMKYPLYLSTITGKLEFSDEGNCSEDLRHRGYLLFL